VERDLTIRYDQTRVGIVDQNLSMRRLLRSSLATIGVGQVIECRGIDEMLELVGSEDIDLLLLDLDTDTERVCREIRRIRKGEVGLNPFLVIIALTWLPEKDIVHLTLTAGTDDVVTKPVSVKALNDRIDNLVSNRKDFVVTTSYIGPERRSKERQRPGDLPTLKVPNSLRAKGTGDVSALATSAHIGDCMHTVKLHQAYRVANRTAGKLVELIHRSETHPEDAIPRHHLRELEASVNDLVRRIHADELTQLAGIAVSMANVMQYVLNSIIPNRRQLEILRLHCQAVRAMVQEDADASKLVTRALETAATVLRSSNSDQRRSA